MNQPTTRRAKLANAMAIIISAPRLKLGPGVLRCLKSRWSLGSNQ